MKRWACKWILLGFLGAFAIFPETVLGMGSHPIPSPRVGRIHDPWLARDKAKHFLASALLTGSATYVALHRWGMHRDESQMFGIGFAFSLGVIKEISDWKRPVGHFSWKDLSFDILGIGVGFLCCAWW